MVQNSSEKLRGVNCDGFTVNLLNDDENDVQLISDKWNDFTSPLQKNVSFDSKSSSSITESQYESLVDSPIQSPTESTHSESMKRTPSTSSMTRQPSRRFVCPYPNCDRSFSANCHLQRHERVHSGEKPFHCPIAFCTSRFTRKDNMLQHYRTHLKKLRKKGHLPEHPHERMDPNGAVDQYSSSNSTGFYNRYDDRCFWNGTYKLFCVISQTVLSNKIYVKNISSSLSLVFFSDPKLFDFRAKPRSSDKESPRCHQALCHLEAIWTT